MGATVTTAARSMQQTAESKPFFFCKKEPKNSCLLGVSFAPTGTPNVQRMLSTKAKEITVNYRISQTKKLDALLAMRDECDDLAATILDRLFKIETEILKVMNEHE